MNGNARKLQRAVEKHQTVGLDTSPFIYFIEDVAPYADLLEPVFDRLENHALRGVTSTVTVPFSLVHSPLAACQLIRECNPRGS